MVHLNAARQLLTGTGWLCVCGILVLAQRYGYGAIHPPHRPHCAWHRWCWNRSELLFAARGRPECWLPGQAHTRRRSRAASRIDGSDQIRHNIVGRAPGEVGAGSPRGLYCYCRVKLCRVVGYWMSIYFASRKHSLVLCMYIHGAVLGTILTSPTTLNGYCIR